MQQDGNFVIYDYKGAPVWATGTNGKGSGPFFVAMQGDCNLVVYGNGKALWASNTDGRKPGPCRLVMQNDRNLVIYAANGAPVWASNTVR